MRPRAFLSLGAIAVLTCVSAHSEAQPVDLDAVLARATRYVGEFVYRFANVVAEETSSQRAPGGSARNLKSDFLLVRLPESQDYLPFRDVFEVDGRSVRDREQRLTTLFLGSRAGAVEQAQKITAESARYNLGSLSRTFNNPIIAIAFLQASARQRFRYLLDRQDRAAGPNVWIVGYREQTRPTIIKGRRGRDLPARGRIWIDADTGRVLKTELTLNDQTILATVTTTFRTDDRFQIDVPVEMKEQDEFGGTRVPGTATYGRFRRFDVTTDETLGAQPPAASGQTPTASELTSRAGRYVSTFLDVFSNVVAEETYEQESNWNRGGQRRELKSDFLLVLPPDSAVWMPFRDVFEVDGRPVRDRQERLTKLLLQPTKSALDRANQIAQESARYNIEASMKRTINNPLLALAFIQADNQARFRFTLDRRDPAEGSDTWIVEYREEARPTAIKGAFDKDMPVKGRYWISQADGRVIRSEVVVEDPSVGARITTDFQFDERFQIDVPVRMSEVYRLINGRVVTGTATYGRFRRFGVSTDEQIDQPR